ncbi:hypothetical protein HYV83_03355 [Candidatus Woesearchaeota archaeon]|nr:hypothetical protein [Candidatus Woesearchaeota archaeon]
MRFHLALLLLSVFISACTAGNELSDEESELDNCDSINDTFQKQHCLAKLAVDEGDVTICDQIELGRVRENCYNDVAGRLSDVKICDTKYPDEDIFRVECYSNVAVGSKDTTVCDKISNPALAAVCYSDVAAAERDIEICNQIKDVQGKEECMSKLNFLLGNCDALRFEASRAYCKSVHGS